ncbi:hypothetical protein DMR96_24105 [Klebsiella pneumoniae]|uniref:hypothetical protein n=1 Tax=Klebsiella pneumoniae TaxID=573 RepID=UPI000D74731A|nr:hypothetical protein [Klebsiella pneumoniae]PXK47800.1 hypothetical protein DMR96_24105 [Klebsiella pneumoniae]
MAIDIKDSINRLDWADELITYLEDRIRKYIDSKPLTLTFAVMESKSNAPRHEEINQFLKKHIKIDPAGMASLRLNVVKDTPPTINLALGDVVENIRISYEYLAQAIAKEHGMSDDELESVYFPSTNKSEDIDGRIKRIFKGKLPQHVENKIKNLEPFMDGKYRIREIAALSNLNKHREPISVINVAKKISITNKETSSTIQEIQIGLILGAKAIDVYSTPIFECSKVTFTQPVPDLSIALHKIKENAAEESQENVLQYLKECVTLARQVTDLFSN